MHPTNSRYSKGICAKERDKRKTGPTTQCSCKLKTAEKNCQLLSEKVPFQMQRVYPRLLIHVPSTSQGAPGQHGLRAEGGGLGEWSKPSEPPGDRSWFELAATPLFHFPGRPFPSPDEPTVVLVTETPSMKYILYLSPCRHSCPPGISSKPQDSQ